MPAAFKELIFLTVLFSVVLLLLYRRSYGVVLWEIVSYGAEPLGGMEVQDIIEEAQTETLQHTRSVWMCVANSVEAHTVRNAWLPYSMYYKPMGDLPSEQGWACNANYHI